MQGFILKLLVKALQNPEVRKFLFELLDRALDKLRDDWLPEVKADLLKNLVPSIAGLLPSFGGSILKTFMDHAPNLPNVENLPQVVSDVAQNIIDTVPDVDLPVVSDAVEGITGIDLSETIKDVLRGFLK